MQTVLGEGELDGLAPLVGRRERRLRDGRGRFGAAERRRDRHRDVVVAQHLGAQRAGREVVHGLVPLRVEPLARARQRHVERGAAAADLERERRGRGAGVRSRRVRDGVALVERDLDAAAESVGAPRERV